MRRGTTTAAVALVAALLTVPAPAGASASAAPATTTTDPATVTGPAETSPLLAVAGPGAADGPAAAAPGRGATAAVGSLPDAGFGVGEKVTPDAPAGGTVADRVLVRLADDVPASDGLAALREVGLGAGDVLPGTGFTVVPTGGRDPAALAAELAADPRVAEVQPDHVRSVTGTLGPAAVATTAGDPFRPAAQPYLDLMGLPDAWRVSRGDGVVIAVLDTGVDTRHPDLAGRLLPGRDVVNDDDDPTDDNGHGTVVTGIAVADAENGVGALGAAWRASVLPVKVADAAGRTVDSDVVEGIAWAVAQGADVLNLSLAGAAEAPAIRDALEVAVARGVVVVAASGNGWSRTPLYPGAYAAGIPGMLAVGATDHAGALTAFSTWGDQVTVAAPGETVVGPVPGGGYAQASGTSMAAPLVSGVAALVLAHRAVPPAEVEEVLRGSARDAGPRGLDPYYGSGVADAAAALHLRAPLPLDRAPRDALEDTAAGTGHSAAAARPTSGPAGGTLSPEGDEDWYRFAVPGPGQYRVTAGFRTSTTTAGSLVDPVLEVRDGPSVVLATADVGGPQETEVVDVEVDGTRPLVVGVRNANGQAGPFPGAYEVTVTPIGADAAGGSPVSDGAPAWVVDGDPVPHVAGVDARPVLTVTLGRVPQEDSLGSAVALLAGTAGEAVPVTSRYDPGTGVLTVTPGRDLVPGQHHQLRVAGLRDATGAVQPLAHRTWFTVAADGDRFTPVAPLRVLDTRRPAPAGQWPTGPVTPDRPLTLALPPGAVPAGASAVVLTVTAVRPSGAGHVRVYPAGSADGPPLVSQLNVVRGLDQAALVTVPLGADASVYLAVEGMRAHLVADLAGYYADGGALAFEPVDPVRVLDLRDATGTSGTGRLPAGRWVDLTVAGRGGVPADATAVVLNVTGVRATGRTHVRVYPTPAGDGEPPTVSNLNLEPGRDQANLVTVPVGDGGRVRLYTDSAAVWLVADLTGYYTSTATHGFVPAGPVRLVDTRERLGLDGPLTAGEPVDLRVAGTGTSSGAAGGSPARVTVTPVPADAAAVVLTVTAVAPRRTSNVRVYPTRAGGAVPLVSTLNVVPRRDEANHAVVPVGDGGQVTVYAQTTAMDLVVDVSGWFRR